MTTILIAIFAFLAGFFSGVAAMLWLGAHTTKQDEWQREQYEKLYRK